MLYGVVYVCLPVWRFSFFLKSSPTSNRSTVDIPSKTSCYVTNVAIVRAATPEDF
jgi:hypothetical protein